MNRLVLASLAASLVFAGCDRKQPTPEPKRTAAPSGAASASSSPAPVPLEIIPAHEPTTIAEPGPKPGRETDPSTRKGDVLALLAGGTLAEQLPLAATEPKREFDYNLRRRLVYGLKPGPRLRIGKLTMTNEEGLPPEVIRRIVRQKHGQFRLCYENGARANPNLQGRVSVRFTVLPSGEVELPGNGGSDLPDSGVVSCVVRAFYGLRFPQPTNKKLIRVTYPLMFSPG